MKTNEQQIIEKLLQYPKTDWKQYKYGFYLDHKELHRIELTMDRSSGTSFIIIKNHYMMATQELINHVDEKMDLETILQKI